MLPSKTGWNHKQTQTERGYGHAWRKIRARVLSRDSHLCQEHKRQGKLKQANQVDHIVPKAKGGTDDMDNLQSLCEHCHKIKTIKDNGGNPRVRGCTPDGYPVGV